MFQLSVAAAIKVAESVIVNFYELRISVVNKAVQIFVDILMSSSIPTDNRFYQQWMCVSSDTLRSLMGRRERDECKFLSCGILPSKNLPN